MISKPASNKALLLSDRVYHLFLRAYPPAFRREYGIEMAQVFRDLCREHQTQRGAIGLIGIWINTLYDIAHSVFIEHIYEWRYTTMLQKLSHSPPIAVIAFLIIPVLFLGRVGVWAIFGIDFDLPQSRIFRTLLDIFIIFGPLIAFGLSALATVQVKFRPEENSLVSITFKKANLVYYAVIVLSITLLSVFGTYLFFENLPCILGQQLTC